MASSCISTQHGNKLGGADVKFIVEDDQGKPDAGVTKAKKLMLQDNVQMFIGGLLASTAYALAPVSTAREDALHRLVRRRTISPSVSSAIIRTSSAPLGRARSRHSRSPNGPAIRATRKIVTVAADYAFGYEIGRRFPEGVRGLRRQDHPEDLAAARHQGFRAVTSRPSRRHRRRLHA